ncbi:universal stress protein [Halobacteria archaeon AArc-m2/3/4]|uniref:Universal stress protein n=1 Tax=Natronoglomus mannanivorans TaxID=2979990 RepID=A0ABT2QEM2_9EURY|nr:universal stress protein [Halobacteria archaeon AArc-m2/3/4]
MYDSVLVATDGSEASAVAVDHGIELAARLEVPLYGLAVVETRTEYDNAIVDPDEVETRLRADADAALESVESTAQEATVAVETALRTGVPHEEILSYVEDQGIDLVVVGSQGRSAFRRVLLGSTADALVRLSPVPVLVVGDDGIVDGRAGDE